MKIRSIFVALLLMLSVDSLSVAQQPTPAAQAKPSKAALDTLVGSWFGPVAAGPGTMTFVVKFKTDGTGDLQGVLSVPEQGGKALAMSDIQFADNKLTFKIPEVPGEYTATYKGGAFDGLWRQGAPLNPPEGVPVVLKKGEYVPPSHALKLSAEAFGLLAGTWNGALEIDGPQGHVTLPIVLRFQIGKNGDKLAFLDSPSQHAADIPVTEASFAAGKLMVGVDVLQGEYNATLSGNSMTGEWAQGGGSIPLTMTRK